ncbi:type IV conjugative transfer system protein TraE [Sphingobium sp. AS12]|uniref:type IV conjugative transfer system protein TraE n=1 Tax=Sphingobium sp. AS12 TaxID=2849495 RepID=UPI000CB7A9C8|nr:type IV conjugative transfer system protein TraE [Sphingobium sp. AS12]MBV2149986.1 type IV conjugative transfer system protein TraE [Sphingobium sp. AS12]PKP94601.1 MAG: conjugal transfer protein TraE [Alphaproteobacteria bacterium HGW-Alphaproteobacteria-16]
MDLAHSHALGQRVLRQRNLLAVLAAVFGALSLLLLTVAGTRDREVVLQPLLTSPVTISSSGVSKDYLEMITRDVAVLTLNRSPQNLDYWMSAVLAITHPRAQGELKAELLKIVDEQRGSSIVQVFTLRSMRVDTTALISEVTGELITIVGNKVVSREVRTFRYSWEYTGLSLKLIGFGMVVADTRNKDS